MTPFDSLRKRAEDARAEYDRAREFRYPSMLRGEPGEDLTDLLDEAEEAEAAYLAAIQTDPPHQFRMATSHPDYQKGA